MDGAPDTIATNNFHRVLTYFDNDGLILHRNSRFQIDCGICQEKHIALLNPNFDTRSRENHESYTVLPHCAHAFGYTCLHSWIVYNGDNDATCPSCREPIFMAGDDRVLPIYGDSGILEQHLEIREIRESIRKAADMVAAEEVRRAAAQLLQMQQGAQPPQQGQQVQQGQQGQQDQQGQQGNQAPDIFRILGQDRIDDEAVHILRDAIQRRGAIAMELAELREMLLEELREMNDNQHWHFNQ
ncbi:uncharacterized protein GGS22DRAFT_191311 [Annulohypoxylon maeteangense]|uniref:uncharacterized protein n=1 Tax=Annulohypoxylon maeteangense TaxID=1927788 RepID=UPI002008469A|nr:uncharacterized protein GGS22DRAFT_191311 [Annulohypoxylon maeteangense]KAI0882141.1 hypothetical protein GGS22DRAFT_191311 [Annulohypoxylon maeteangense]